MAKPYNDPDGGSWYMDEQTGWSEALACNKTTNNVETPKGENASYRRVNATWFYDTWFDGSFWARKFTNVTNTKLQIVSGSFMVVSGHSGGQQFAMSDGLGSPASGYGCKFKAKVFLQGNNTPVCESESITLPTITKPNCSSNDGPGTVSKTDSHGTSFGSPRYYAGQTDDNGNPIYIHPETVEFENGPVLEPGQSCYIVIEADFDLPSNSYAILVISKGETEWEAVITPVASNYIWQYTADRGWVKERKAFMFDGTKWNVMEG